MLARFGYTIQHWRDLEADVRSGLETTVEVVRTTADGTPDEIRMTLQTPRGLPLALPTSWQSDGGTDVPRLMTLSPDWAGEVHRVDFIPYQDVVLWRDIPEEGVWAGDVGIMVDRYDVPGRDTGYSADRLPDSWRVWGTPWQIRGIS